MKILSELRVLLCDLGVKQPLHIFNAEDAEETRSARSVSKMLEYEPDKKRVF